MAICGLSWVNYVETASLATNSQVSTLPLANLQDLHGSSIWRSTSNSAVYVTLDMGAAQNVKALMAACATFSASATWRLLLSSTNAHTGDIYDSGVVAMNRGLIANVRSQACMVLPQSYSARYAKVIFDDPGLASPGYFDVGLLWLSDLWQPQFNFSWGAQGGLQDDSQSSRSIGGQVYTDIRDRYRVEQFTLNFLRDAEYFNQVAVLDGIAGTARNLLFVPDPGNTYQNQMAMIGRLSSLELTSRSFVNGRSRQFKIEERI